MPHEVLSLSPWELGLAVECLRTASAAAEQRMGQINARGGMVFPVVVLHNGGL